MPQEQAPMYREIQWSVLESSENGDCPSDTALQALECASTAALAFDAAFSLRSKEREQSIPLFDPEEIMIGGRPYRSAGYFTEYELRRVRIVMDLAKGAFHSHAEQARSRFAERVATESGQGDHEEYEHSPSSTSSASSSHYYYAVKYLQAGLMESDHATTAAVDMILETKILMNLAPHPNIMQIYGVNGGGIDSLLAAGRRGFFIVTDRLSSTLVERLADWRRGKGYGRQQQQQQQNDGSAHEQQHQQPQDDATATSGGSGGNAAAADEARRFTQRLEIALDIASALVYLHDRELVLNVRPEKVGFDTRYDRIKLCNFSQARQDGMTDHARSITKSDNVVQTLAYTAPEVLCKAPVTVQTDVFAFGIMLWEMMSLKIPFEGYDRSSHFEEVVQFDHRPTIMPKWPGDLKKLLQGCWDPHFRPTMKMVHETLETALLFTEDEPEKKQEFVTLRRQESGRHFEQQQQHQSSQSSLLDNNNDDDDDDNDEDRMESQHQDSLSSPTASPSVKSGGSASASSRTGRHVVRVPANKARSRSKDRRKSGDSSSGSSSLHNITMTPKSSSSRTSIRKIKKGVDPPQSPATVSGSSSTPGKSSTTTTRKKKIRSASLTKQHQQQMNKSFADMDSLLTELGLEEPDASFLDHYTDKHKRNSNNHHHHHDVDKDNDDEEGTSHTHNADASSSSGGSIDVNHSKDNNDSHRSSSGSTARRSSSRGRAQSRRPSAKQSAAGGRSRSRSKDRRGHSRSRSLSVNRSKSSKPVHNPDDDDREFDVPESPDGEQKHPSSPNARSSSSSRRHISKSPSRKSSHGNSSSAASMRSSTSSRSRSGSTTQQRRGSKHGSSSSSIQRSQSGDFEYPSSPAAAAASSGRETTTTTTRRVLVRRKSSGAGGGGSKGGSSNSSSNRSSSLTAQIKQEMSHSRRQYNSSKKSSSKTNPAGHASMSQIDFSTNSTDSHHDWDE